MTTARTVFDIPYEISLIWKLANILGPS
jgi:hypothetical protein